MAKQPKAPQTPEQKQRAKYIQAVKTRLKFLPHADEESVRRLYRDVTGHESLTQMDVRDLGKVLTALQKLGCPTGNDAETARQQGMIKALWAGMYEVGIVKVPDGYKGYCQRVCKLPLEALSTKQCQWVTESLKKWWARETGQAHAALMHGILSGAVAPGAIGGVMVSGASDVRQ